MPNDSLHELRETNLRDPEMHAKALFSIEGSTEEIAREATHARELAQEHLEVFKERYAGLSSFLLHGSNVDQLPRIERHVRHIKYLLAVAMVLLLVLILK